MVAKVRFVIMMVVILSCCIPLSGMGQQQIVESFFDTVEKDSSDEIKLFVDAYGSWIDHQTWCRGLHRAIIRGDLEVVQYVIAQGNINVATEDLGIFYKTGNKPSMALDAVQVMLDNAHCQEDINNYKAIKTYIQTLIPVISDQNDAVVLPLKQRDSCTNKTCLMFTGSLLCWLLYWMTMYNKNTVPTV